MVESKGLFADLALGDEDGIHWNSFIASLMPSSILTSERLREAFDALDVERVGYLTESSFRNVLADDVHALDDGLASLFKGGERVDFKAFETAFRASTGSTPLAGARAEGGGSVGFGLSGSTSISSSGEGATPALLSIGPAGGSASGLASKPRAASQSSLILMSSLALSPTREGIASLSRRPPTALSALQASSSGESFPLGLPVALGPSRSQLPSVIESSEQGFRPAGIASLPRMPETPP